jgi:heme exporter protein B
MKTSTSLSQWKKEILEVFRKEWRSESRALSGITTTAQLCFVSLVIINNITWFSNVKPLLASGLYWLILIFIASITLPRTFLQEEENRSADFWRMVARPESVFWGKCLFNCAQMLMATLFMSLGMVLMLRLPVSNPLVFAGNSFFGSIAIALTVTLAGALAAPAQNRYTVCAAISVPLLVFVVNLGMTGTAFALGEFLRGGERAPIAMIAYCLGAGALGPVVYSRIWKS